MKDEIRNLSGFYARTQNIRAEINRTLRKRGFRLVFDHATFEGDAEYIGVYGGRQYRGCVEIRHNRAGDGYAVRADYDGAENWC